MELLFLCCIYGIEERYPVESEPEWYFMERLDNLMLLFSIKNNAVVLFNKCSVDAYY